MNDRLAQDLLGDRLQLQVGRALVDLPDLGVAVQLLDRVVLDEAVAAEQVHRERRDALGDFRRRRSCRWPLRSGTAAARRAAARRCRRSASPLRSRWPRAQSGTGRPGSRRSPCRTACAPSCSAMACSSAPRASPIIWAPMPIRPSLSVSMADLVALADLAEHVATAAPGSRRRAARRCCWRGCRACLPSCRR